MGKTARNIMLSENIANLTGDNIQVRLTYTKHALLVAMSLVHVNDLLHLVVTAHEDTRSVMYVLRYNSQHAIHLAVDRLAAS